MDSFSDVHDVLAEDCDPQQRGILNCATNHFITVTTTRSILDCAGRAPAPTALSSARERGASRIRWCVPSASSERRTPCGAFQFTDKHPNSQRQPSRERTPKARFHPSAPSVPCVPFARHWMFEVGYWWSDVSAPTRNTQHASRNTHHASRNTQHATRNTQHASRITHTAHQL